LRAQVAHAINRKRAPELTFMALMYVGGGDG